MKLINLKKTPDYNVEHWLFENIRDLTEYQKDWIRDAEIIRFAPFQFYEKREKVNNVFVRISVVFMPLVWFGLFVSLPINFLISGKWGYNNLAWYSKWVSSCGL